VCNENLISTERLSLLGRQTTSTRFIPYALILGAVGVFLLAEPALADDGWASHDAPEQAQSETPVRLLVKSRKPRATASMRLRFRRPGEQRYEKVHAQRKDKVLWEILLPAGAVKPPFLEYFIVLEDKKGKSHLIFASPQSPHRLRVTQASRSPLPSTKTPTPSNVKPAVPANAFPEASAPDTPQKLSPTSPSKAQAIYHRGGGQRKVMSQTGAIVEGRTGLSQQLRAESSLFASEQVSFLASRYEQDVYKAPSMVSVVGRDRIEGMGARSLIDILKSIQGLETSLHITGFDLVSVRGLQNDARILLLVDGQPLANPYDGRNYWNIPASHIERVEVIRGPGSALHGAGAFSAVVQVTTRKTKGLEVQLQGGSFETVNANISTGFANESQQGAVNTHFQYSTGPKLPIEKDALSEANVERPIDDMMTHATGYHGGLTASYQAKLGEAEQTRISGNLQIFGESRGPYIGYFDTVGPGSQLNWMLWSARLGLEQKLAENTFFNWRVYGGQHSVNRLLQLAPPGFSTPDRDGDGDDELFDEGVLAQLSYQTFNWGTEGHFTLKPNEQHTIVAGAEWDLAALPEDNFQLLFNRDLQGAVQPLGAVDGLEMPQNNICDVYGAEGPAGLGACRMTLAAFVQEEWRPTNDFSGTLGFRFTSFSDLDFEEGSDLQSALGITPRMALVWEPLPNWIIKTMAASSFRAPTFEEKYDQTPLAFSDQSAGVFVGNQTLSPEEVTTLELGTGYSMDIRNTRYAFFANAFASNVDQVIEHIDVTGGLTELTNQKGYDIVGLEGEARLTFPAGHVLFLNGSWHRAFWGHQEVDDQLSCRLYPWEDTLVEDCTLITDVPQLRANWGAYFNLEAWGAVAFSGHSGSPRKNNWRSQLEQLRNYEIASYTLVNWAYHSPEIFEGVNIRLLARNLLQEEIRDPVPRPDTDRMPGLLPRPGLEAYAYLIWRN